MKELFEMLDENDKVERFAWFVDYSDNLQGTAYTRIFDISDDSFTPEGKVFAGVEDEPDAGDGSGTGEESGTGDGTGTGEESGAGDGSGTGGVTIGDDPTPGAGEVIDTPDPGQGEESGTPNDGKQDKPKPPHNGNKIAKSVKQVVITVAIVVKTVCKAILKIFGR